ncbi:MAG: HAD family hydrolase [Kovacikia sp.]
MVTIQCGAVRFPHIQAVIFDKDGTIANSQDFLRNLGQKRARLIDAQIPGVQEPLLMAFGLDGGTLNPAGLVAVGTRQENAIAAAAYVAETGRDWMESLEIVSSAFSEADRVLKRKADATPPFDGVEEVLRSLAAAGIKAGILSSDSTANVQDFVERYGLDSLLELKMGTDAGGPSKPDPTLFYQACAALAVPPSAVLMIGDSVADLKMAQAAKAGGSIGVTWGWTRLASLKPADVLINSLAEVQILL